MAYENLEYTKNWKNATDFPTYEPSETKVREDMQYLFDEIKTFVNDKLVTPMNAKGLDDPFDKHGDTMDGDLYISKDTPTLVLNEMSGSNCYGDVSVAPDKHMRLHVQEKGGGGNLPQAAGLMIAPFSGDEAFDDVLQVYTTSWEVDEHGNTSTQESYRPIIPAAVRMTQGTYTGTGEFGAEHPNTLTTWHLIRSVLIWDGLGTVQQLHPLLPDVATMAVTGGTNTVVYDSQTPAQVSWYSADDAAKQFNTLGQTYYYMIFG